LLEFEQIGVDEDAPIDGALPVFVVNVVVE
jgi:hypothetical protein